MDTSTVQLLTAAVGVAGTLAAAILTQLLARKAERERRAAEDRGRWLQERQRVNSQILGGALSLEREIWSACSHLDRDRRSDRMQGRTSIFMTPEDGITGVFDKLTRTILVEAIEDSFLALDTLEILVAESTLIGTPQESMAARALHESLWDAAGMLET